MMREFLTGGRAARLFWAEGLVLSLVACGGASPPVVTPEPPSADSVASPEPSSADADEPERGSSAPPPGEAQDREDVTAGEPVNVQTFQNALQAVLNDPALLQAMDRDPSSAEPIVIAGKDLPSGLERTAATRPVEVVPVTEKPGKRTILLFTRIELSADHGTFKYRYEATGAFGTTRVAYEGGAWQLKSSRVSKP